MERPLTRRGSAVDNQWQQNSDEAKSGSKSSAATEQSLPNSRPFSRMASEYASHKNPSARVSTALRPGTSELNSDGVVDVGSHNRLSTTTNRPGSRSLTSAMPGANLRVLTGHGHNLTVDRPTTQQGLGGLKSAFKGPQRQVQDKSYFLGLLRTKMTELNTEMTRLVKGIEKNNKEMQNLPALENKVKEMAVEITDLQGQAADLNLLQEKIATSSDPAKMENELKALQAQNEKDIYEVEHIFEQVKTNKEKISALEKEMQLEHESVDQFITTLSMEEQKRYADLKENAMALEKQVESATAQIAGIEIRTKQLQQELAQFPAKEEFYRLHQTVADLEKKQKAMLEQEANRLNPDEERAQLLNNVRSDNAEVAAMEQQIKDLQNQVERVQNELRSIEDNFEESQTERGQKYRDLRKREQAMDEFLSTFQENCQTEKAHLTELEQQINHTLVNMGKSQSFMHFVPSVSDFYATKESLLLKEGELEKSRATLEGIAQEYQRLNTNLQKLEELEGKITEELATLKDNLATMQINSVKFGSIDELRHSTEQKRNQLILEQQSITEKRSQLQSVVDDLQAKFDELQAELNRNETHVTLRTLEDKLTVVEKDNEAMRTFLAQHRHSHDVSKRRQTVMNHVTSYMNSLKASVVQQ